MSSYLVFGYHLGDLASVAWHREQAARFGKKELEECGGAFDWLTHEDAYADLPDTVARKALEAWYTPDDIEAVPYPWGYLQEKRALTVERVGWCEDQDLVLCSYPFLKTTDKKSIREVQDLVMADSVRRNLMQACKALNLGPDPVLGDIQPRWLLADVSGY